eukprot:m.34389 g.34389  ORF g.34389 m.34389 type:complete len:181 (-) comp11144_c0_seq1:398-940(-)
MARKNDDLGFGAEFHDALGAAEKEKEKERRSDSISAWKNRLLFRKQKTGEKSASRSHKALVEAPAATEVNNHAGQVAAPVKAEFSGWMTTKKSTKATLSRRSMLTEKWFVLKNGSLSIHDSEDGPAKEVFPLANIQEVICESEEPTCSLQIVTDTKTLDLMTRSEEECAGWLEAFRIAKS